MPEPKISHAECREESPSAVGEAKWEDSEVSWPGSPTHSTHEEDGAMPGEPEARPAVGGPPDPSASHGEPEARPAVGPPGLSEPESVLALNADVAMRLLQRFKEAGTFRARYELKRKVMRVLPRGSVAEDMVRLLGDCCSTCESRRVKASAAAIAYLRGKKFGHPTAKARLRPRSPARRLTLTSAVGDRPRKRNSLVRLEARPVPPKTKHAARLADGDRPRKRKALVSLRSRRVRPKTEHAAATAAMESSWQRRRADKSQQATPQSRSEDVSLFPLDVTAATLSG